MRTSMQLIVVRVQVDHVQRAKLPRVVERRHLVVGRDGGKARRVGHKRLCRHVRRCRNGHRRPKPGAPRELDLREGGVGRLDLMVARQRHGDHLRPELRVERAPRVPAAPPHPSHRAHSMARLRGCVCVLRAMPTHPIVTQRTGGTASGAKKPSAVPKQMEFFFSLFFTASTASAAMCKWAGGRTVPSLLAAAAWVVARRRTVFCVGVRKIAADDGGLVPFAAHDRFHPCRCRAREKK